MSLTEPARRRDGSSRSARDEALVSLPARSSSPAQELLRRGLLALGIRQDLPAEAFEGFGEVRIEVAQ